MLERPQPQVQQSYTDGAAAGPGTAIVLRRVPRQLGLLGLSLLAAALIFLIAAGPGDAQVRDNSVRISSDPKDGMLIIANKGQNRISMVVDCCLGAKTFYLVALHNPSDEFVYGPGCREQSSVANPLFAAGAPARLAQVRDNSYAACERQGARPRVKLGGGNDRLRLTPKDNRRQANDKEAYFPEGSRATGGRGHDRLIGGSGPDHLSGGPGNDRIDSGETWRAQVTPVTPSTDRDVLVGGSGRDRIDVRDGGADKVRCGNGRGDFVNLDLRDRQPRDCEEFNRAALGEALPAALTTRRSRLRRGRTVRARLRCPTAKTTARGCRGKASLRLVTPRCRSRRGPSTATYDIDEAGESETVTLRVGRREARCLRRRSRIGLVRTVELGESGEKTAVRRIRLLQAHSRGGEVTIE